LDYSTVSIELLDKIAKERGLPIRLRLFDVKGPLPFQDNYFDAVYSHMLLNMRFSFEQLHFILSEIRRVLKPRGLNFFSVRNQNDNSYGKGAEVDKGIYDINGFQIRFFAEKEIRNLVESEQFEILWIQEAYEEPVTLYLVSSRNHG
jgi:SAM-dependent methyltransferase